MREKHKDRPHARKDALRAEVPPPLVGAPISGTPEAATKPADGPALHLLRVTIEAKSPLALGSGDIFVGTRNRRRDGKEKEETFVETALARDAYGLPTVPGATIQGLL